MAAGVVVRDGGVGADDRLALVVEDSVVALGAADDKASSNGKTSGLLVLVVTFEVELEDVRVVVVLLDLLEGQRGPLLGVETRNGRECGGSLPLLS